MTLYAIILSLGSMWGMMGGNAGAGGSSPPACGATHCVLTEAGADLQTESGSNIITET